jgi:hypothetical protein
MNGFIYHMSTDIVRQFNFVSTFLKLEKECVSIYIYIYGDVSNESISYCER